MIFLPLMNVYSNDTLDKKYPDDYINGDVKPYSIHSVHIGLIFDHVGLSGIGNPPIWWFVIIFVQWIYLPISIFMRPHGPIYKDPQRTQKMELSKPWGSPKSSKSLVVLLLKLYHPIDHYFSYHDIPLFMGSKSPWLFVVNHGDWRSPIASELPIF